MSRSIPYGKKRAERKQPPVAPAGQQDRIDRLSIELDGVLARLRRGSVSLEEHEGKRTGDVYREVKVGAVFEASRGPERSELAPGVFVDQAGEKHYVARRSKAEGEGLLLYALAVSYGLQRAHQFVVLNETYDAFCAQQALLVAWLPTTFHTPYSIWPVELLERIAAVAFLPDQLDVGYRVLLDKDQRTAGWKQPSYQAHIPARPTEAKQRLAWSSWRIQRFWRGSWSEM